MILIYNTKAKVVLLSGGLASFEVARRVKETYFNDDVRFWFFDTLLEDSGLYKFLSQIENYLNIRIETFTDGRNMWEVFKDERFIGNSRVPLCTRVLKRELLEKILHEKFPKKSVILFLGYEYSEIDRMDKARKRWNENGYEVAFPLMKPPFLGRQELIDNVESRGLDIPRLYNLGFYHNNCGGACVRAGIHQWLHLLKLFPDRYLWHEEQEQKVRTFLDKDVSILRDRTGGTTKPLTLRELRLRNISR